MKRAALHGGECGRQLDDHGSCSEHGFIPTGKRLTLDEFGYRLHDLRHTCVSRLMAAGADVKLVQAIAGHANPLITLKRYTHLLDTRVTEAAARFDPGTVQRS